MQYSVEHEAVYSLHLALDNGHHMVYVVGFEDLSLIRDDGTLISKDLWARPWW